MKPIPADIFDFPLIRKNEMLYVDKTSYFHRMITDLSHRFYFISRPRRFGKSMMISTLKAIFQGKRELFDGLDIARTDYDWKQYPVIHLNMGFCARRNAEEFAGSLPVMLEDALSICGCKYDRHIQPADNFRRGLEYLASKDTMPVILIDEYDDPVAQVISNPEEAETVRSMLAPLYKQIKECSGSIRFVMITGASKFTKMSIFSALSNLQDISLKDEYATMLGFTEAELDAHYGEYMARHAAKLKLTMEQYRSEQKRMYNGYRFWCNEGENVYNPVSINMNLLDCEPYFKCYWTSTGRPSMLMNFLKRENVLAIDPEHIENSTEYDFDVADLKDIPVNGLLFQTGYLTITDFNPYSQRFTLGIPDEEVRRDFALLMASLCAKDTVAWASEIGGDLLGFEWEKFFNGLKSLYAGVAYGPKEKRVCEHSYARCLMFMLQGQGIVCSQEVPQADGRIDMVCTHPCGIYVFELKVDKPAAIAMSQIERRNYVAPYAADERPKWLVGLSFCSENRLLVDCVSEQYI